MSIFSDLFRFGSLNVLLSNVALDEHQAYISQLNAMLEKQKRDAKINKQFTEKLKEQDAKLKGRVIEGELEVIEDRQSLTKGE
jgi:hypothetical protein